MKNPKPSKNEEDYLVRECGNAYGEDALLRATKDYFTSLQEEVLKEGPQEYAEELGKVVKLLAEACRLIC